MTATNFLKKHVLRLLRILMMNSATDENINGDSDDSNESENVKMNGMIFFNKYNLQYPQKLLLILLGLLLY